MFQDFVRVAALFAFIGSSGAIAQSVGRYVELDPGQIFIKIFPHSMSVPELLIRGPQGQIGRFRLTVEEAKVWPILHAQIEATLAKARDQKKKVKVDFQAIVCRKTMFSIVDHYFVPEACNALGDSYFETVKDSSGQLRTRLKSVIVSQFIQVSGVESLVPERGSSKEQTDRKTPRKLDESNDGSLPTPEENSSISGQ